VLGRDNPVQEEAEMGCANSAPGKTAEDEKPEKPRPTQEEIVEHCTNVQRWWSTMRTTGAASAVDFGIEDAFRAIDADGNGELSMSELITALTETGNEPLSLEDVTVLYQVADIDGNGTVSGEEFTALLNNKFVVIEGDTLHAIAKRTTGNADNWKEVAEANGITDPTKMEVGAILVIPHVQPPAYVPEESA